MSSPLSLHHYSHELLSHRHAHAQLVFGLSGQLDFEVAGRGSLVTRDRHTARRHPRLQQGI